jgi:hypothetical protein
MTPWLTLRLPLPSRAQWLAIWALVAVAGSVLAFYYDAGIRR